MRILVVEDQADVAEFLVRVLGTARWAADVASCGAAALERAASVDYDLIILDLGLPDIDGLTVCRTLRGRGVRLPVLVLTAYSDLHDRVRGLDSGADDYLAKPFEPEELLARLRALLRRQSLSTDPVLRVADLTLDPALRRVERAGRTVPLSPREYAVLEYLLRMPHRVVSRLQLIDHVWDDNIEPAANAVEVLVSRVRRKIDGPSQQPLLHTVRGAGYLLTDRVQP